MMATPLLAQSIYTPYAFTNFVGQPGGPGVADGSGRGARFKAPTGVALDSAGNVYVADQNNFTIRKITPQGLVTTIAGTAGQTGTNNATGSAARFGSVAGGPTGIAIDNNSGNIYVSDTANYTIRKLTLVNSNWQVTTLAGTGGLSGTNDNTGAAARFSSPTGLTVDRGGNIYVTDNFAVRRITPAGVVTTIAGSGNQSGTTDGTNSTARFGFITGGPKGIAVDSATNLYVADTLNNTIRKITPVGTDWVVTTLAGTALIGGFSDGTNNGASFSNPYGATFDNAGNLYVSDTSGQTIRKISFVGTNAIVTTIAGAAATFGFADGTNDAARFQTPDGMATDSAGNLYVADFGNDEIRKMTPSGTNWIVTTLAGQAGGPGFLDGTGNAAQFDLPDGIAIDASSNLYIGDTFNHTIRKVTAAGVVTTIAGSPGNKGYADGVGTAQSAQFNTPLGLSMDSNGNLYIADSSNDTIRKITPAGIVTTFAGQVGITGSANLTGTAASFNQPASTAVDSHGNIYVADLVNRTIRKITSGGTVSTFAGTTSQQGTNDGVGGAAKFMSPQAVAVDSSDNIYVADQGGHTIRKITSDGTVTTLAGLGKSSGTNDGVGNVARFNGPQGVAVDKAGNVYVADTGNQIVRIITPGGSVTTLAGLAGQSGSADGTNRVARFAAPRGIAVDGQTNIYVSDVNNSTIRKLVINGTNCIVTTFAGTAGQNGDVDALGTAARFHSVFGLVADPTGNLYAADRYNAVIRKITPDGNVTTFAGVGGTVGSTDGSGGAALFYGPEALTVDGSGNIYVIEFFNNTVRKIAPNGTNWNVTTLAGCPTCAVGTNDGIGSAARFSSPFGIARDSSGNLYVADTTSHTIRKLTPSGTNWSVSTFVGAPNTTGFVDATGNTARLLGPHDIAIDTSDNLYISDGNMIRKITPAGAVTTIANCPPPGCANSQGNADGFGSTASFYLPRGLAVDHAGNIYVADSANDLIRRISPTNGNWLVTTLGGTVGQASGKEGVGADALFNQPSGVAVDAGGSIYVVNSQENSIMKGSVASATTTPPTVQFDTTTGGLVYSGGSLQMRVTGASSGSVIVEMSSNLQTWIPVQTDTLSGSSTTITIPSSGNPREFFRAYVVP